MTKLAAFLNLAHACDVKGMHRMADQALHCVLAMQRFANEWWFRNGEATFADGDSGDVNHAMLAEEEMLNRLGFDIDHDSEWPLTHDYAHDLFRNNIQHLDDYNNYLNEIHEGDEEAISEAHHEADLYEYLLWKRMQNNPKLDPDQARREMDAAWKGFRDPSKYAVENFGWHRVHGNRIETFNLNANVLQDIVNGLYDVYDERAENMEFYIEVHNPRKHIGPVTLADMESGKVLRDSIGPGTMTDVALKRLPENLRYYNHPGD